jgi:hypothetical protein
MDFDSFLVQSLSTLDIADAGRTVLNKENIHGSSFCESALFPAAFC